MRHVLIVEDRAETRRWLAAIVTQAFPAARLIEASTLRAAVQALRGDIDLMLIDHGLPDGDGLALLRGLRAQNRATLCVLTTAKTDDMSVVAALSSGADGYLLKDQAPEMLSHQLVQLAHGLPALSPMIARRIMDHFRLTGPSAPVDAGLTPRETEVLALLGRGLRNAEVASALGLSDHTVAGYVKAIYRKLGISSRAEASWHASRLGLSRRPGEPKPEGRRQP